MTTRDGTALIGHTGFVGSNLASEVGTFDGFNSKNFRDLGDRHFERIICAGVQAVKWWANQNPEEDWAGIARLLDVLNDVTCDEFILISTVDVYKTPVAVDEDTPIILDGLHPYGLHRWRVEEFVRQRYDNHRIIRLPGLFGPGLKKNLIFDVLNDRSIDGFDARSSFQFYNLGRLAADLDLVVGHAAGTYNFAVPPLSVASVVKAIAGHEYDNQTENPPLHYDMRTKHAALWGRSDDYLASADDVLKDIRTFAQNA